MNHEHFNQTPYSKAKYDTISTGVNPETNILDPYSKAKYDTMTV